MIVSVVLAVALVAALPAVAMITEQYLPASPEVGRPGDASLQTPGRAEYCGSNPSNNCDNGGIPDKKDK